MLTPLSHPVERRQVGDALRGLISDVVPLGLPPEALLDDANLYDHGLDSTSVVELVLRIEERFQLRLSDDDLDVELFQRLGRLVDCVMRNLPAASSETAGAGEHEPGETA
jgi:acyl carrier protein